ncbi:MAG: protein-disulfide reductase DsbD family protein [Planctomycetota bacterium]|nr:protein-disulfide reductase DsbD family protein [Planctomycetota bacterium]
MNLTVMAYAMSLMAGILPVSTTPYDWGEIEISLSEKNPRVGDTVTLQFKVTLQDDYTIYSPTTKASQPTTLSLKSLKGLRAVGSFKGSKFKTKADPDFDGAIAEYYEHTATFYQKIKVTGEPGDRNFQGSFEAQVCKEACVPIFLDFTVAFKAIPNAPPATPGKTAKKARFLKEQSFEGFKIKVGVSNENPHIGEEVEVQAIVTLNEGYHVYSASTDHTMQTSMTFDGKKGFRTVGTFSAGPFKSKPDPNFDNGIVQYYEKKATFVQKIKITGEQGGRSIKGVFGGQVCKESCIMFDVPFEFSLKAQAIQTPRALEPARSAADTRKILEALEALGDEVKQIKEKVQRVSKSADDNHKKVTKQIKKINGEEFFDEVISYHHSWEKGLEAAKKSGKKLFVVFTGHFCTNCRRMETTELINPKVLAELQGFERVVLHVDDGSEEEKKNYQLLLDLGGKGPIPAYYVLDPTSKEGTETKVDGLKKISAHTGLASTDKFVKFLKEGSETQDTSTLGFILTCIGLGLLTLIMPCTYPMIPITISVFSKGDKLTRATAFKRASIYAAGIIVSYTAIGGLVQIIMGGAGQQAIQNFANNGIVNLFIGGIFIYFAFSFFGYYEIAMPNFLRKAMQFGQPKTTDDGSVPSWSLFLMGAFFMLTSYACGAPFVLAVFEQASQQSQGFAVVFALFLFSSTLAIPFLFLALVPGAIRSMPKAGGWFTTFKVTLGFFELAFALKFLSTTDIAFQLEFLTRPVFLGIWILIFGLLGLYLLGFLRFAHDPKVEKLGMGRFILALLVLIFTIYLASWFAGQKLQPDLNSLMVPERYPTFTAKK